MDLCTVISEKFINQAINLIQSYKTLSYNRNVFVYHFNTPSDKLDIFSKLFGDQVILLPVQEVCDHALNPRIFFYKIYAINDCLKNHSESMMYSDSANCFVSDATKIDLNLIDDSLFLSYPYEKLTNQYWTTKKCLEVLSAPLSGIVPQYWAGFQVYKRTEKNIVFVDDLYRYMSNIDCAGPVTSIRNPDGEQGKCVEHRCDQSVLSILIHKHNRHQFFDIDKNSKYGDWQTLIEFDSSYKHDFDKMILSPRESKFGNFRFLKT